MGITPISQKEELRDLIKTIDNPVPKTVLISKNKARTWEPGYDPKYDFIVISKDGTIGDVVVIQNLKIALPSKPKDIHKRSSKKADQYWEPFEYPKELRKIGSMQMWNRSPKAFKEKWIDYIDTEFERREEGFWFYSNGVPTYITGHHYMYLQWTRIDVGLPDYREANRVLFIFFEACKVDKRSYGMIYLKIRRSGASYMGASTAVDIGTLAKDSKIGILSKTGDDAKSLFIEKLVPMSTNYPFFFKPIQSGMDRPRTELSYRVPAKKITHKNMFHVNEEDDGVEGLNTTINWKNTGNNSYDSEKLKFLLHDESGKWLKPNSIKKNLSVTRTCLRVGRKIKGVCMMVSTCNPLAEGGDEFRDIYFDSDVTQRNKNGGTKSGLYSLFIPMEWNMEGFIDIYGMPVMETPEKPVMGIDGELIHIGAIEWWKNEEESLKGDPDSLNEFYRQNPRVEDHAFRDKSDKSLFNLTKLYDQIDYNEGFINKSEILTRGYFAWRDGKKDTEVVWIPDPRGRFITSWIPNDPKMQNNVIVRNGLKFPGNEHLGAFGCDPYDISGTVGGSGSKGALSGLTKFHVDNAPVNHFFLEYIARPQTAEMFFEDVLMALHFYGMPALVENNKPRLLYHLKNRGYRPFSINRPDKPKHKLSYTEKELGGIPNSSEAVKQAHAAAIETYIEKYVGLDREGLYRDPSDMGDMYFTRTLRDWVSFDITNRTKYDAAISSGLAIMATQKGLYEQPKKPSKININFAKYNNKGVRSKLIDENR